MDFLEHVEEPELAIREAARLVAPGGLFIFHTFNRNWLAWLVVIKGVEWFVRNTPPHMHVLRLFIKPEELVSMCARSGLAVDSVHGMAPVVFSAAFWKLFTSTPWPTALPSASHGRPDFLISDSPARSTANDYSRKQTFMT